MLTRNATSTLGPALYKKNASTFTDPNRAMLAQAIQEFCPISLDGLQKFALLNRVERKVLLREDQLINVLGNLKTDYRVLEVDHRRMSLYRTLYFDTDDYAMYKQHHAGVLNRYKVRSREYVNTQRAFLEVKLKNNKRRMMKNRIVTDHFQTTIHGRARSFLAPRIPYAANELRPAIQNSYTRITFASVQSCERLTIDLDLGFYARMQYANLPGIVVAEVKQERLSQGSAFLQEMRRLGIRHQGFSKYCMGINLLLPELESNNFKVRQMRVQNLLRGTKSHDITH